MFDPLSEMSYTKGVEMVAEAIPGVIIQLSAIMETYAEGKEPSFGIMSSLLISLMTTGFTSASISYDWDTDRE